ncbi:hypothetical protein LshimejAT787_2400330 [Lyophyllum shimeji]|uniref:Uncharacterized protein n=1 Tax=Lyophyllum shimeji TaxID=47721 RepID=A0A9P3Q0V3_LYOSH|nr:hypothetical protein LshimejAT787_2400330 [Lyophyllum shimeji]
MAPRKKSSPTDPSETVPTITPTLVIRTRAQNKNTHPGVAAGVAPGKRCTPQEMQEAREREQRQQQEQEQQEKDAIQNVASIEDCMCHEDEERRQISRPPGNKGTNPRLKKTQESQQTATPRLQTVDDRSASKVRASKTPKRTSNPQEPRADTEVDAENLASRETTNEAGMKTPGGSQKAGQRQQQRPVTSEQFDEDLLGEDNDAADSSKDGEYKDDSEDVDDDRDSMIEDDVDCGKPKKIRKTKSGRACWADLAPPQRQVRADITAARETNPAKGTPLISSKRKVSVSDSPSSAGSSLGLINNESELDVQYGGILGDREGDEIKCPTYKTNQAVGPKHTTALPPMIKIKAEPSNATDTAFSNHVVPLACKKAGSREGDPWQPLSADDVQSIVDTVYGIGKYEVRDDNVWCGLVNYRLNNWRNGFSTTATDIVKQYFTGNPDHFSDADTIEETVLYMLETQEEHKTKPFHWKRWDEDENGAIKKKGPVRATLERLRTYTKLARGDPKYIKVCTK